MKNQKPRSFSRSSTRARNSRKSCSGRTSAFAIACSRSENEAASRPLRRSPAAARADRPPHRREPPHPAALPRGRGREQGLRQPLHRDRRAEQQPGQPLRGQLPAPLHARLPRSHPDRPGDHHQPDRRGVVRHPPARREDERAEDHRLEGEDADARHRHDLHAPRRRRPGHGGQDRRELLHQPGRRRRRHHASTSRWPPCR